MPFRTTTSPLTVGELIERLSALPADKGIVHIGDAFDLDLDTGEWALTGTQTSVLSGVQEHGDDIALIFNGHGTETAELAPADVTRLLQLS